MFFDTGDFTEPFTVAFRCVDCHQDFARAVRHAPEEVCRCLPCEQQHVRAVSDRLLAQLADD